MCIRDSAYYRAASVQAVFAMSEMSMYQSVSLYYEEWLYGYPLLPEICVHIDPL